jgi:hypothetical protein
MSKDEPRHDVERSCDRSTAGLARLARLAILQAVLASHQLIRSSIHTAKIHCFDATSPVWPLFERGTPDNVGPNDSHVGNAVLDRRTIANGSNVIAKRNRGRD